MIRATGWGSWGSWGGGRRARTRAVPSHRSGQQAQGRRLSSLPDHGDLGAGTRQESRVGPAGPCRGLGAGDLRRRLGPNQTLPRNGFSERLGEFTPRSLSRLFLSRKYYGYVFLGFPNTLRCAHCHVKQNRRKPLKR